MEIIGYERKFVLESQYSSASTVDGTRSYRCFIPQSNGCLILKRISIDCYYGKHEFFNLDLQNDYSQYKHWKYVACFYDGNWYIGIILECPYENQDCSIKFMKRNSLNLHWISDMRSSCCRVTFKNLICIIDLPQAVSSSGWQYILSKNITSMR